MLAGGTIPTAAPDAGGEFEGAETEAPGDGTAFVAGAVACVFINSCRTALFVVPLCEYKIDRTKVSMKKMAASQLVIFVSTLVVWAPKMFSVTPPPNAAPRPSLFGRCIKITRVMSNAVRT